jgi:hypothetical protein
MIKNNSRFFFFLMKLNTYAYNYLQYMHISRHTVSCIYIYSTHLIKPINYIKKIKMHYPNVIISISNYKLIIKYVI